MKRLGTCLVILAFCGIVRGDGTEGEELAKKLVDTFGKIVKTMEGIKDKESAEKAKPELEKQFADIQKTSEGIQKLSKEDRKKLEEAFKPKVEELGKTFSKEMLRISMDAALVKVLDGVGPFRGVGRQKEQLARFKALMVEQALQAYKLANKEYPATLAELSKGDKPFIKVDDLKDPWDKMYQYDAKGPKNKGLKPDIWTVNPDGKTIGNWLDRPAPPRDKTDKDGPGKDKPTDKPAKDNN